MHLILCCAACNSRTKEGGYGQHNTCDVFNINKIINYTIRARILFISNRNILFAQIRAINMEMIILTMFAMLIYNRHKIMAIIKSLKE